MPSRRRSHGHLVFMAALLSVGAGGVTPPVLAQGNNRVNPAAFPGPELFRELKLQTMACGRDNSSQPCQQARTTADPLMDHPLLPAACKDTLWSIRQRAVVASTNSYDRREALNRDATDVVTLCKPATKPVGSGGTPPEPEANKKGGGLGGFLRGLGGGGGGQQP